MNTNEISLKLTADIKGIKSALTQVQKDLKKFGSETTGSTEGLNNALQETEQQLTNISVKSKNFARPAVNQFANLRKGAGAANGSVIAFGRIIQDLPFGILGVANNIQSFSEQFSSLGNDAQKSGSRLSQFFSALITPTNLAVLAVSAVTAAWQAYNLGVFDAEEETKDLRSETEKLNESLDNVVKSLNAVSSARLQSNKGASDELVELELLNSVLNDTNKSEFERSRAYNLLLEKYPRIISNITEEKALVDGLGDSYLTLVSAIGQKSAAIAIEDKLVELAKQRLDLVQKEQNEVSLDLQLRKQKADLQKEEADAVKELTKLQEEGAEQAKIFTATAKWIEYGQQIDKVDEELKNLGNTQMVTTTNALIKNAASVEFLKNEYVGLSQSLIALLDPLDKVKKRTIEIIPDIKLDRGLVPNIKGVDIPDLKIEPELEIKGNEGYIQQIQARIEAITQLRDASRNLAEIFASNLQLGLLQNQLASLNGEEVKSNLEIITDAFGSMGAGIAASLNISNRALRGFVTTLISATPKIISAIMAQAAAKTKGAAIGVVADKKESLSGGIKLGVKAAEALGPIGLALLPVFIAGAVALISGAFSKIGGGGGGGSVSAGQGSTFTNRREFGGPVSKGRAYIVGERRPELFVPNTNGIIVPQLPSMDYSGASMAAANYGVDIRLKGPDDLLFFVEQAQIRRGIR